jgi:hypothetical protein
MGPEGNYRAHKSPQLDSISSQINPLNTAPSYLSY